MWIARDSSKGRFHSSFEVWGEVNDCISDSFRGFYTIPGRFRHTLLSERLPKDIFKSESLSFLELPKSTFNFSHQFGILTNCSCFLPTREFVRTHQDSSRTTVPGDSNFFFCVLHICDYLAEFRFCFR